MPAQNVQPYDLKTLRAQCDALFDQISMQNFSDDCSRLRYCCEYFLEQRYQGGALGEGLHGLFDQNPLYRFDAFDCVTYVNTLLALFFSNDSQEYELMMKQLGYLNGCVRYEFRHHFTSVDWNPEMQRLGYLQDVTMSICDRRGNRLASVANTLVDRPAWFRCRGEGDVKLLRVVSESEMQRLVSQLQQKHSQVISEESTLPYLHFDVLFDENKEMNEIVFSQIPDACVIEIVRPNWNLREVIGTNLNVSHLGIVCREEGALQFYHAALNECVKKELLVDYLKRFIESPTIRGINVQKIAVGAIERAPG